MKSFLGPLFRRLRALAGGRGEARQSSVAVAKDMVFARLLTPGVTETATVSEVIDDGSGNPHIRYTVSLRDQHGTFDEGTRVLALNSFLQNYRRVS